MTTIRDIARALGITPSTVSRALSGNPRVKEETRQAVEKTAREMGYERNIVAANLRKGRSMIVGIVIPRIHREFFSNCIGGAESILNQAGYSVLICQTLESVEAEIQALKTLKNYRVAGVLLSHAINAPNGDHVKEILGNTPLIQFDRVFPDLPGAKIVGANCDGAYKATRHLIEAGYRKIGTLAGYMTSQAYVERLAGYRMALEDAGLPFDEKLIYYNTIVRETGYEAGLKAIKAGCDALYSAGAFSALGAIDALKEKDIRVPEDFGIVGTANEGFAALMTPSLSTLNQHPFEMGEAAAHAFLEGRLDTQVIPMELIERQSSNKNNTWQK
ncbi:MAG: LacI family DNA-binding transcriptional regulator [Bacteroidales bacterium]|nr:LacI family DNA-binding transcriptional regulator [Bacteroidales bacterium]